ISDFDVNFHEIILVKVCYPME
ncbi:MAG: hypothetical protein HW418_2514, partial [Anaerolineales bacterium]|nr:hypothetical protein [Anaerolineales bacterium]